MFFLILLYVVVALIYMCFWGWVATKIGENKGYPRGSFFWWGFWLEIIGILIVLTKPDRHSIMDEVYSSPLLRNKDDSSSVNGWRCPNCGRINTGAICTCGTERKDEMIKGNHGWRCPNCGRINTGAICPCGTERKDEMIEGNHGWKCPNCGTYNLSFVGTCGCGFEKAAKKTAVSGKQQWEEIMAAKAAEEEKKAVDGKETERPETDANVNTTAVENETVNMSSDEQTKSRFDEIKAYKELLDSGIISQEEFDRKKRDLLGL